jgi:LacI family transcriptional regulator
MKNITIKEIAKEAGVSIATVSNVLNKKPNKASEQTKRQIYEVVEKYHYSPNMNARSLVNTKSGMYGILYYSSKEEINFSDPFLSDILTGIEYQTKRYHKFILVHGFADVEDIYRIQQSWNFDGYIVIGAIQSIHDKLEAMLSAPVVFVDTYVDESKIENGSSSYPRCYVYNNDFELSYQATQVLLEKGHERIAVFSPTIGLDDMGVVHERYFGYKKALEEEGIDADHELFYDENELNKLVRNAKKYSAVLVNSDYLAAKLAHQLKEKNILDKSIISFDNSFFSELLDPSLTTVELNQKDKGKLAVKVLHKATQSGYDNAEKRFIVEGEIIHRKSVTEKEG